MAYAFVQQAEAASVSSVSTLTTPNFAAGVTAGNLIWVVAQCAAGTTVSGITDTLGNTYAQCTGSPLAGAIVELAWFYAKNITGGANAVKATFSGAVVGTAVYAAEYSGLDKFNPFSNSLSNTQTAPGTGTNAVTSTAFAPKGQPVMMVGLSVNEAGAAAPTAGTGFTARTTVWTGTSVKSATPEDERITATSAAAATWTVASGQGSAAHYQVAAFFFEPAPLKAQTLTSSEGTITSAVSSALTGQSLTSSVGTLTASVTHGITGQSLTSSEGLLSSAVTVALTGQSATFTEGTITATVGGNVTLSLAGQTATFTEGVLAGSVAAPLSGQTLTSAEGALTPSANVPLAGQSLTSTEGVIAGALSYPLPGQTVTSSEGVPTGVLSYALAGESATFTEGAITPSVGGNVTLSLTGQSATFSQGALTGFVGVALSGQTLTSSEGTPTPVLAYSLSGQTSTSSAGTLTPQTSGDVTVQLSALQAVFALGQITVSGGDTAIGAGRHHRRFGVRDGERLLIFDTRLEADQAKLAIAQRDLPAPKNPKRLKVRPIPIPRETLTLPQVERIAQQVHETDAYEDLLRSQAYTVLVQRYDAWVKRQAEVREEEEIAMILLHL